MCGDRFICGATKQRVKINLYRTRKVRTVQEHCLKKSIRISENIRVEGVKSEEEGRHQTVIPYVDNIIRKRKKGTRQSRLEKGFKMGELKYYIQDSKKTSKKSYIKLRKANLILPVKSFEHFKMTISPDRPVAEYRKYVQGLITQDPFHLSKKGNSHNIYLFAVHPDGDVLRAGKSLSRNIASIGGGSGGRGGSSGGAGGSNSAGSAKAVGRKAPAMKKQPETYAKLNNRGEWVVAKREPETTYQDKQIEMNSFSGGSGAVKEGMAYSASSGYSALRTDTSFEVRDVDLKKRKEKDKTKIRKEKSSNSGSSDYASKPSRKGSKSSKKNIVTGSSSRSLTSSEISSVSGSDSSDEPASAKSVARAMSVDTSSESEDVPGMDGEGSQNQTRLIVRKTSESSGNSGAEVVNRKITSFDVPQELAPTRDPVIKTPVFTVETDTNNGLSNVAVAAVNAKLERDTARKITEKNKFSPILNSKLSEINSGNWSCKNIKKLITEEYKNQKICGSVYRAYAKCEEAYRKKILLKCETLLAGKFPIEEDEHWSEENGGALSSINRCALDFQTFAEQFIPSKEKNQHSTNLISSFYEEKWLKAISPRSWKKATKKFESGKLKKYSDLFCSKKKRYAKKNEASINLISIEVGLPPEVIKSKCHFYVDTNLPKIMEKYQRVKLGERKNIIAENLLYSTKLEYVKIKGENVHPSTLKGKSRSKVSKELYEASKELYADLKLFMEDHELKKFVPKNLDDEIGTAIVFEEKFEENLNGKCNSISNGSDYKNR